MRNRTKVMILIILFWLTTQIVLLGMGFASMPVLIFVLAGSTICNMIGMCLDVYNEKVGQWFNSRKLF
jgi:hypothetical protein